MGDIVTFKSGPPAITRQSFIESVLALGRSDGLAMNLPAIIDAARSSAWREVNRIAESCCEHSWNPVEQENYPLVSTVDPAARPDLVDAAALVVACDRLLADLAPKPRTAP